MTDALKPLKWYTSLSTRKGRLDAGAFMIEGERAVSQVINRNPGEILEIITIETPRAEYQQFSTRRLNESQFHSISNATTPQGIMAVVKSPPDIYSSHLPVQAGNRVLLLEDVQDPGNTGTLIRTAAAFGFSGIIMTDNCADPLSPKCVQSTAGSILSLWIRRTSDYATMVEKLRREGYILAAAVLGSTGDPSGLHQNEKLVLALGNEASGLSEATTEKADLLVTIPVDAEKAESLNVAVCGAILMYLSTQ